jgi:hypothetical protein
MSRTLAVSTRSALRRAREVVSAGMLGRSFLKEERLGQENPFRLVQTSRLFRRQGWCRHRIQQDGLCGVSQAAGVPRAVRRGVLVFLSRLVISVVGVFVMRRTAVSAILICRYGKSSQRNAEAKDGREERFH